MRVCNSVAELISVVKDTTEIERSTYGRLYALGYSERKNNVCRLRDFLESVKHTADQNTIDNATIAYVDGYIDAAID